MADIEHVEPQEADRKNSLEPPASDQKLPATRGSWAR